MPLPPRRPTRRLTYAPATRMMRDLFAHHQAAAPQETSTEPARDALTRRRFLGGMGAAAGLASALPRTARATTDARVVIIGAGLAGLNCAAILLKRGVIAEVYEAANRIGGRVFSDSTTFGGLVTERGGAFISTEHNRVRNLARRNNLQLEIINGGALPEGEEVYRIDGDFYTFDEANADWRVAWKAFKQDLQAAPFPQTFDNFSVRGQELDNISIPEWFDPSSPFSHPILADFGPDSRFAKLCYATAISEYGADPESQPALNLLYLLAFNPKNSITPLAGTDEFYRITGGNEQLIDALAAELPGTIHTGKPLEAISTQAGDPAWTLCLPLRRRIDRDCRQAGVDLAVRHLASARYCPGDLRQSDAAEAPGNSRARAGHQRQSPFGARPTDLGTGRAGCHRRRGADTQWR